MQEPTFLVLTALAGRPLHGYGVRQEVEALSGGRVTLRAGTLYTALDRLSDDGLIEVDHEDTSRGRLRRYYRLTADGASTLAVEADRLVANARTANRRLAALKPTTA